MAAAPVGVVVGEATNAQTGPMPEKIEVKDETLPKEWRELFRIGDAIAASKKPQDTTMTTAVTEMRR